GQVGRISRSALRTRCHIDVNCLQGREECPVSDSDQKSGGTECINAVQHGKSQKADGNHQQRSRHDLMDMPFVHEPSGSHTRKDDSARQKQEEYPCVLNPRLFSVEYCECNQSPPSERNEQLIE